MIYVLNLYNLVPGREAQYRDYMRRAGPLLREVGAKVLVAAKGPSAVLRGDNERAHLIVVEFPDKAAFDTFYAAADEAGLHRMRETATANYIWTIYDEWDLGAWVSQGG